MMAVKLQGDFDHSQKDGVLKVTLPKKKSDEKPVKQIAVK
jgi:HSP20 family molecular chaperone IbpA